MVLSLRSVGTDLKDGNTTGMSICVCFLLVKRGHFLAGPHNDLFEGVGLGFVVLVRVRHPADVGVRVPAARSICSITIFTSLFKEQTQSKVSNIMTIKPTL